MNGTGWDPRFSIRHLEVHELVPDDVLKAAYLWVGERWGCYREKLIARTEAVHAVKHRCGPEYAHVSDDWFRARVIACCKSPSRHGGGWGSPERPAKGRKKKRQAVDQAEPTTLTAGQQWYADYLASERWQRQRERAIARDGGRCRVCNDNERLEVHHRSYEHARPEADELLELRDLTTMCRRCHKHMHICVDAVREANPARAR